MSKPTSDFLRQMEARRRQKPSPRSVDMRGKVPGECRCHEHNGRQFWLDDISYAIFKRGLDNHQGIFTVGTYEAIINGPHTNRAIRERQERQEQQQRLARQQQEQQEAATLAELPSDGDELQLPERITFGYYQQRHETRLLFATRVTLRIGTIALHGKTRNISASGIKIYLAGEFRFKPGDLVTIEFTDLRCKDGDRPRFPHIIYSVAASSQQRTVCTLQLQLDKSQAPESFTTFLDRFLESNRRRNRVDVEEDFLVVLSRAFERLYSENMLPLPLFIGGICSQPVLRSVAYSSHVKGLAEFFHLDGEQFDFRAFALPQRLRQLLANGCIIIALYREGDRICSAADCEFDTPEPFLRFIKHTLKQRQHRIIKVQSGLPPLPGESSTATASPPLQPLRLPPAQRFEQTAKEFGEAWAVADQQRAADYEDLIATAQAIDMTPMAYHLLAGLLSAVHSIDMTPMAHHLVTGLMAAEQGNESQITAWCGAQRFSLTPPKLLESLSSEQLPYPKAIDFRLLRPRQEERIQTKAPVHLELADGSHYEAISRDISLRGLAICNPQPIPLERGDELLVGLPNLQELRPKLPLSAIRYRVVRVIPGKQQWVMLQRDPIHNSYLLDPFFEELMVANRKRLPQAAPDMAAIGSAHGWEGVVIENLSTIPLFFGRSEADGLRVRMVALSPESDLPLLNFFQSDNGGYDFSILNSATFLHTLRERCLPLLREQPEGVPQPAPVSIELYLYKQWDEKSGSMQIIGSDDSFLSTPVQRIRYLRHALQQPEYCFVRLIATRLQPLDQRYNDALISSIYLRATYRGLQLEDRLVTAEGYAEMIDITDELTSAYQRS